MPLKLSAAELATIESYVALYQEKSELFKGSLNSVEGYFKSSDKLQKLIHSMKSRLKDPEHLKDKLIRKALLAKEAGKPFPITKENLFSKITDLAGVRILHLHTKQFEQIDKEIKRIFSENAWIVVESPKARTWDDEMRAYFAGIGIKINKSSNLSMYTSVHYVFKPNRNSPAACEIQVRTLMEEVWGEVDHTINYPHKTESDSCREQIKVLARVTSSCSRLVDSIFSTYEGEKTITKSTVKRNGTNKKR